MEKRRIFYAARVESSEDFENALDTIIELGKHGDVKYRINGAVRPEFSNVENMWRQYVAQADVVVLDTTNPDTNIGAILGEQLHLGRDTLVVARGWHNLSVHVDGSFHPFYADGKPEWAVYESTEGVIGAVDEFFHGKYMGLGARTLENEDELPTVADQNSEE